jgi:hypothetical protein
MKEPRRLMDGDGPSSLLVTSMQGEGLSPEAKLRLRASLGLGVAAGVATVATTAGAATAAKGAAVTTGAKSLGALVFAKWIGIVAVGAVAVGGVGVLARTASVGSPSVPSVPSTPMIATPSPARTGAQTVASVEETNEAPPPIPAEVDRNDVPLATPPPRAAQAAGPRAKVNAPQARPDTGDLTEELRLLEIARRSLRAGDAAGALVDLQRYRASAPRRLLAVEADVLEVEALVGSGRRDEAIPKGRAFLARHGKGPLSERVARLIETERR